MNAETKAVLSTLVIASFLVLAILFEAVSELLLVSFVGVAMYVVLRYFFYKEIFLPYFQSLDNKEEM